MGETYQRTSWSLYGKPYNTVFDGDIDVFTMRSLCIKAIGKSRGKTGAYNIKYGAMDVKVYLKIDAGDVKQFYPISPLNKSFNQLPGAPIIELGMGRKIP